jgi:hypothetical protein
MTKQRITLFIFGAVLTLALACPGCGATVQQQEDSAACIKRCNLDMMGCLESRSCMDENGQMIPCEDSCARVRDECESQC